MVSLSLPDDERGQLLLVGAAVIALVIVGSVILLNGLKFTDTVGTEGNFDATDEAQRTAEIVRDDLSKMASHIRSDTGLVNYETAIRQNISIYSNRLSNMTFADSATYVNVSFNKKVSQESGVLVKNTDPDTWLEHPSSPPKITVAEKASMVNPFNLTVTDFSCGASTAEFEVTVTNHTTPSDSWSMTVTCDSGTRVIRIQESSAASPILELRGGSDFPNSGDVDINLVRGTVEEQRWNELQFVEFVKPAYDISIKTDGPPGRGPKGTYRIGSDTKPPVSTGPKSQSEPLPYRPAFTFVYERPGITYNTTINTTMIEEGGV